MSSNDVQTLANSIIGTSILAMPFCFAKCGIILSIVLLIISTTITRACCNYLIKASIVTRRRNMELLGFYIFGSSGKALVEISVIGFLMGTCVAFFVVIGDLCPILVSKLFNIQNTPTLRLWMIILTTLICIIPLSFQQSIKSLSFVCKASIAFYICLTLKTILESFYTFRNDDHWASNIELWNLSGVLQCIPIFSMAMSCQMQLFEVYENISSFDRIRGNIYHATSICLFVYTTIGFFGYVAFYNENLSGNVLVNFRPSFSNDIIKFGFILSIACSFPLVVFPCRTSLNSLLHKSKVHHHSEINPYVPESRYKPLTLFIILFTMIIGILIPSVEVIIGFVGSTIGILICVLFPATCFVKIMQRNSTEKVIAQIMIVIGFVIMVLGTYSNLLAFDKASSGSHLPPQIQPEIVANIPPPNVLVLPENVQKVKNESAVKEMGKISEDGIKKEELEMQSESPPKSDAQNEIKQKDIEIKELKESKQKLEKEVLEIKQELVKQNKETQQLVLQKFEEIAEKVDKIQSIDKEEKKEEISVDAKKEEIINDKVEIKSDLSKNVIKIESDVKPSDSVQIEEHKKEKEKLIENVMQSIEHAKKISPSVEESQKQLESPQKPLLESLQQESSQKDLPQKSSNDVKLALPPPSAESNIQEQEEVQESEKLVVDSPVLKNDGIKKEENLGTLNKNEDLSPKELKLDENLSNNEKQVESEDVAQNQSKQPLVDPIVQHIVQKSQEPLSYQVGEKIMEEKKKNLTFDNTGSREDPKNEMRRKRNTLDELVILQQNPLDVQMKSMLSIGRDLKNVNEEHDES